MLGHARLVRAGVSSRWTGPFTERSMPLLQPYKDCGGLRLASTGDRLVARTAQRDFVASSYNERRLLPIPVTVQPCGSWGYNRRNYILTPALQGLRRVSTRIDRLSATARTAQRDFSASSYNERRLLPIPVTVQPCGSWGYNRRNYILTTVVITNETF